MSSDDDLRDRAAIELARSAMAGKNLQELSERSGVPIETLRSIINGSVPDDETLAAILNNAFDM